jgi:hypothetical protein
MRSEYSTRPDPGTGRGLGYMETETALVRPEDVDSRDA